MHLVQTHESVRGMDDGERENLAVRPLQHRILPARMDLEEASEAQLISDPLKLDEVGHLVAEHVARRAAGGLSASVEHFPLQVRPAAEVPVDRLRLRQLKDAPGDLSRGRDQPVGLRVEQLVQPVATVVHRVAERPGPLGADGSEALQLFGEFRSSVVPPLHGPCIGGDDVLAVFVQACCQGAQVCVYFIQRPLHRRTHFVMYNGVVWCCARVYVDLAAIRMVFHWTIPQHGRAALGAGHCVKRAGIVMLEKAGC